MTQPINLEPADVLAVVQQRFPREYEIAVQAVYIRVLEQAAEAKSDAPTPQD